ncbi:hypothetical protein HY413_03910, partial [Candidatus Kaiserbacteria bacterium]|nr:hypothetical protein [Candidatus Kaiserbacteria bacterium]
MSLLLRLSLGAALAAPVILVLPSVSSAAQVNVSIGDSFFSPKNITINASDTVVWTHVGGAGHTVTADDGSFNSGLLQSGQSFTRTFSTSGTYPYYCIPHGSPGGVGMSGTITVLAAAPLSASPPAPIPVLPPVPAPTPVPPTTADKLRAQAEALLAKVQQLQAQ